MPARRDSLRASRCLLPLILIALLCGCGKEKELERQPSPGEVRAYIAEIERKEAAHKAETIRASRAKEKAAAKEHAVRLQAEN